jgi:hypothetical protein
MNAFQRIRVTTVNPRRRVVQQAKKPTRQYLRIFFPVSQLTETHEKGRERGEESMFVVVPERA